MATAAVQTRGAGGGALRGAVAPPPPPPPPPLPATPLPRMQVLIIAGCNFINSFAYLLTFPLVPYMVLSFFPDLAASQVGYYSGLIEGSFHFGALFGSFFWGWAADRYGRRPVLLSGLAGTVVFAALFGLSSDLTTALATKFVWGLLNSTIAVAKTSLSELCDDTNTARAFSYIGVSTGSGRLFGPMIGGLLAQPTVKYPALFARDGIFGRFPFLLPCLACAAVTSVFLVLGVFFLEETRGRDDGFVPLAVLALAEGEEEGGALALRPPPAGKLVPGGAARAAGDGARKQRAVAGGAAGDGEEEEEEEEEEEAGGDNVVLLAGRPGSARPSRGGGGGSSSSSSSNSSGGGGASALAAPAAAAARTAAALPIAGEFELGSPSRDPARRKGGAGGLVVAAAGARAGARASCPLRCARGICCIASCGGAPCAYWREVRRLMRDEGIASSTAIYTLMALIGLVATELFPVYLINDPAHGGFSWGSADVGLLVTTCGPFVLIWSLLLYDRAVTRFGLLAVFRASLACHALALILTPLCSLTLLLRADGGGGGGGGGGDGRRALAPALLQTRPVELAVLTTVFIFSNLSRVTSFNSVFVIVANSARPADRSTVNGIGQATSSLMRAVGPPLGTALFAWSVSESNTARGWPVNYSASWYVVALLTLACLAMSYSLPPWIARKRPSEAEEAALAAAAAARQAAADGDDAADEGGRGGAAGRPARV